MDLRERLLASLPGYPPEVIDHGQHLQAKATCATALESLANAYRTVVTIGAKPTRAEYQSQSASNRELEEAAELLQISLVSEASAAANVVTVFGELDDPDRHTPIALANDGDLIYLLGSLPPSLQPDFKQQPDFKHERLIGDIMIAASRDGLLNGAHAVTDDGFLTALAQMAMLGEKGARFWIPDGMEVEAALFSSAPGRIICVVPRSEELRFSDMCIARYVPLHRIGVVDGDVLEFQDHFTIAVADLNA